jgi:hypothetical protein
MQLPVLTYSIFAQCGFGVMMAAALSACSAASSAAPGASVPGAASSPAPVRVACVGEQTTHSAHRENDPEYPTRLQQLLGSQFVVVNFGLPKGRILKEAPAPDAESFFSSEAFDLSKAFQPDVVVFGPWGRHDTYEGNWPEHKAAFAPDLAEIVRAYVELPSKPVVLLVTPLPLSGTTAAPMAELVEPTQALAKSLSLPTIDLWSAFQGHPEWYKDSTHLTPDGQQAHAKLIATALKQHFPGR